MGLGDEILVSGRVCQMVDAFVGDYKGQMHLPPVVVCDRNGRPRWSELWANNHRFAPETEARAAPGIEAPDERYTYLTDGPGARPYIKSVSRERFVWNHDYCAHPGLIPRVRYGFVPHHLRGFYTVVNWRLKPGASPNKAWPRERWVELVKSDPARDWVELGPAGIETLPGVRHVVTPTFLDALAVIAGASLVVTIDGAVHHAAAAYQVPAVVLWTGFVSPAMLGYAGHVNICHASTFCGSRQPCDHCAAAANAIGVAEVYAGMCRASQVLQMSKRVAGAAA